MGNPNISKIKEYDFFQKLTELPFVKQVLLFGSWANATNREHSHIDLAIDCSGASELEWRQVVNLLQAAETALVIKPIRFDAFKSEDALKAEIMNNHIVLYYCD